MTDIQQARDVLAKWRQAAKWQTLHVASDAPAHPEQWGAWTEPNRKGWSPVGPLLNGPDSLALIVGTAGNPELLDALDALLADELVESGVCHCGTDLKHHRFEEHGFVDMGVMPNPLAQRIAAAIIAADERMTS